MVKEQDKKKKRGHWQRRVCKSEIITLATRCEIIFAFYFHITKYNATLAKFLKWIPFTEELLLRQTKNLKASYKLNFFGSLQICFAIFEILAQTNQSKIV